MFCIHKIHKLFQWQSGPPLPKGRGSHACTTMTDSGKDYIVVAGGILESSMLYLDITNGITDSLTWQNGPEIPTRIFAHQLLQDVYEKDVLYLVGGTNSNTQKQDRIYILKGLSGSWEWFEQKLTRPLSGHLSFWAHESQLPCK